jgi:hypothetical protein
VIDCSTNAITHRFAAPAGLLQCDANKAKVYAIGTSHGIITVFDAREDSLLLSLQLPDNSVNAVTWNSTCSRVYVAALYTGVHVIRDTTTAIAEEPAGPALGQREPATFVRGVLRLPEASSPKPQAASWLVDIGGRKVMDLHPGPNDVSRVPPGVYFVCPASGVLRSASGVTKVILQH